MISKTEQAKELFKNKEYQKAFKLMKGFDRTFSKEEMKLIGRTYEMFSNENFYKQLGFNFDDQLKKAIQIVKDKYKL